MKRPYPRQRWQLFQALAQFACASGPQDGIDAGMKLDNQLGVR